MNVNQYNKKAYENKCNWALGENKPNSNPIQTQFKPNQSQFAERAKLMQSLYLQRIMKKIRLRAMKKQSQNKPNSNPIKACPERSRMGQFERFIYSDFLQKKCIL